MSGTARGMKLGNFFCMSGMKVLDYRKKWDYISISNNEDGP